jgi:hypothetical protein
MGCECENKKQRFKNEVRKAYLLEMIKNGTEIEWEDMIFLYGPPKYPFGDRKYPPVFDTSRFVV